MYTKSITNSGIGLAADLRSDQIITTVKTFLTPHRARNSTPREAWCTIILKSETIGFSFVRESCSRGP